MALLGWSAGSYGTLEEFARGLNQGQRRRLRCWKNRRTDRFEVPDETTFFRVLKALDPVELGKLLVQWETDRFGWTAGGLLGIDGKAVGNGGQHLLGAVDLKSGLGWMRRIVIAEYYQWKPEIKQPREATSAKSLQHNRRHETMLINLFTSPA